MSKSYGEQMLELRDAYRTAGEQWPATAAQIATWAVQNGEWDQDPEKKIKACAHDLSDAFRGEKYTNAQGKRVRTMAAAKRPVIDDDGKTRQEWFWCDVREGYYEHVLLSFLSRRGQIGGDVASLRDDLDNFNTNCLPAGKPPITMTFDFDSEDGAAEEAA